MSIFQAFGSSDVNTEKLGVNKELLSLLYEIGILGAVRSYFVQSQAIFEGYIAIRPKSEIGYFGLGLLSIAIADYDLAIKLFKEKVLVMAPDNDVAKAYLGVALKWRQKTDEAKKILNEVITANREPAAVEMAKGMLKNIEEGK